MTVVMSAEGARAFCCSSGLRAARVRARLARDPRHFRAVQQPWVIAGASLSDLCRLTTEKGPIDGVFGIGLLDSLVVPKKFLQLELFPLATRNAPLIDISECQNSLVIFSRFRHIKVIRLSCAIFKL
jgi:hypothetical protein